MALSGASDEADGLRLDDVVSRVCSALPDSVDIRNPVEAKLRSLWRSEKTDHVNQVLGTSLSPSERRRLLFYPTVEDANLFVRLVDEPPNGAPENDPQRQAQIEHLTLLYLYHVPHGDWDTFSRPFILAGGLDALANVLVSSNLYLRGQAVDTLLQLTGGAKDGSFDWWQSPASDQDHALHVRMLALQSHENFRRAMLLNSQASRSYPGGPLQCLQLFAFWVSWARQLHSPTRRVQLGRSYLAALAEWGEWSHGDLASSEDAKGLDLMEDVARLADDPVDDTLLELRSRLLQDFRREGCIEGAENSRTGMPPIVHFVPGESQDEDEVIEVVRGGEAVDISDGPLAAATSSDAIAPQPSSRGETKTYPTSRPETLPAPPPALPVASMPAHSVSVLEPPTDRVDSRTFRMRGNDAFAAGKHREALEAYDSALGCLQQDSHTFKQDVAVLQCNRATVLLAIADEPGANIEEQAGTPCTAADKSAVEAALEAADRSIKADPGHVKAHYRMAQAFDKLGRVRDAIESADRALECCTSKSRRGPQGCEPINTPSARRRAAASRAAVEALQVSLMSKLAGQMKLKGGEKGASQRSTGEDAGLAPAMDSDGFDRLGFEADILSQILSQKTAHETHAALAPLKRPEPVVPHIGGDMLSDPASSSSAESAVSTPAGHSGSASGSEDQDSDEAGQQQGQLVRAAPVVETGDASLRGIVDALMEPADDDSDDDDVIDKRERQAQLKKKRAAEKLAREKKERLSSQNPALVEKFAGELLASENDSGNASRVLKKTVQSEVRRDSSSKGAGGPKSTKAKGKKGKQKPKDDKKAQLRELRKLAAAAPTSMPWE